MGVSGGRGALADEQRRRQRVWLDFCRFGSPFSGHERHLWGDTKAVMVSAGGDTLRYYRNWNLITDAEGNPTLPEEGVDESYY